MLHTSTVEAVKAYPDIVGIISDYVTLKKRGKNFLGLCPFHSEKTPSFNVSPEKKIWHCFGCHESGDHIAFVMKMDNLNFTDAVKVIAKKAGIPIQETAGDPNRSLRDDAKDQLLNALFEARELFARNLQLNANAKTYLMERGLHEDTIAKFHLGFGGDSDAVLIALREKGVSDEQLQESGLFFQHENGRLVFRFSNRLIFPINDHLGRVLGFGGRIFATADRGAKYVNSPESGLFNKSRILYGFDHAKAAIRKSGVAIVVEGYMDVLISSQSGFENVVGVMGTALTPQHVQLLKRQTSALCLAFDSDVAGQQAIDRSEVVLRQFGMKTRVAALAQKDPADMILSEGAPAFANVIDHAEHILDFRLKRLILGKNLGDIDVVSGIVNAVVPSLIAEPDLIVKNHFIGKLASVLKIERELIVAKLQKSGYTVNLKQFVPLPTVKNKFEKAEEYLLYIIASDIDVRESVRNELSTEELISPAAQQIFQIITGTRVINHELLDLMPDGGQKKRLSEILMSGAQKLNLAALKSEWKHCVATIKQHASVKKMEQIREKLGKTAELSEQEQDQLLHELTTLINLTKKDGL